MFIPALTGVISAGGAGGAAYSPNAVTFDGSDYLTKTTALAGAATKQFSMYARIKPASAIYGSNSSILGIGDGSTAGNHIIRFRFAGGTGNSLLFIAFRGYSTYSQSDSALVHTTTETFTDAQMYNVLFSFNSASGSEASTYYIGDTAVSGYSDTPVTDYAFAWNETLTARIGSQHNGANQLQGEIGTLWAAPTYYDFSNAANRRLFFDASGNPVAPPSGAVIFFGGKQNASAWNAGANQGTGGNFTVNGAVTEA